MGILKTIFSSGVAPVIKEIGGIFDKFHTSDEERLQAGIKLEKVINMFTLNMEQIALQREQEITKRHDADSKSDSWLAKNVRPLTLAFLTVNTFLLAYLSIFILPPEKVVLLKPWLDLLTILLVTVYGFYFGSRGIEKISEKIANAWGKNTMPAANDSTIENRKAA